MLRQVARHCAWLGGAVFAVALVSSCELFVALAGGAGLRCDRDESCPVGMLCTAGQCQAAEGCASILDCAAGYRCHPIQKVCVLIEGDAGLADGYEADGQRTDRAPVDRAAADARRDARAPDQAFADISALDGETPDRMTEDRLTDRGPAPEAAIDGATADAGAGDGPGPVDGSSDHGAADVATGDHATPPNPCQVDAGSWPGVAIARPATRDIALDGRLDDWSGACFLEIGRPEDWVADSHYTGTPPLDTASFTARFAWLWTTDALWLAVFVSDDIHFNDWTGSDIWRGDSIQAAFDMARNGGTGYDATDDYEFGWAMIQDGQEQYRWHAPSAAPTIGTQFAIDRTATTTGYEIRFRPLDLGQTSFATGSLAHTSLLVADNDGEGRAGWLEWASGIGLDKDPSLFLPLQLVP
ncbi:MAG: hypothetical protein JXR83_11540 [Deltaproteobacteria bacterium]|nr:hypothetical protein [Deltaproteobacteria bacterium]